MNSSTFLLWKEVQIKKGFWKQRQEINEQVTLPAEYEQCKITGRIDSVKCVYQVEKDVHPMKGVFTIDGVLAKIFLVEIAFRDHIITGIQIWQNGSRRHPIVCIIIRMRKLKHRLMRLWMITKKCRSRMVI